MADVTVKVLGTGCPKCRKLYAEAEKAVALSGGTARLEKVESIDEIVNYGVLMAPGLVVAEEVRSTGRVPKAEEIAGWIAAAARR